MSAGYLVDTSAFMRLLLQPDVGQAWSDQLDSGQLMVCPVTELEIFYSAQSVEDRQRLQATLNTYYAWVPVPDRAFHRAVTVQADLAERGMHRSAGPVDLLVAATAEQYRMTVLHYDRDFLTVARVTGQAVEWVASPDGFRFDASHRQG